MLKLHLNFCFLDYVRVGGGLLEWHGLRRITFLGHKNLGSMDAEEYVKKRSSAGKWDLQISVLDNLIQPEAAKWVSTYRISRSSHN